LPLLSDDKKELLEVNKEIDFAYTHEGKYVGRFRINAFYSMKTLSAAFRLIPDRIRTIEELKLPTLYHQFTGLKQGMILITGPTGHGKSTTLAAMLEDINRTRFCRVITIEDPIEYVFQGKKSLFDQREMGQDTHSWQIALKSAMREDPDVILVGEMRDYETISSAITLAETGHLVFATLHTNNASQSIDRMIDVFPEEQQAQVRSQLSNILEVVIAQRLIPVDRGGRRAVQEILMVNPAVKTMIREAKTHQVDNVIRTSSDVGMVSLERSLVDLIREGVINVSKAQEYALYPEEISRLLKS
jgi:twitching motility protein PilT